MEVKDGKRTKNQVADHLSHLEEVAMLKLKDELEFDDMFLVEQVLATSQDLIPCFEDFANYLVSDVVL